MKPRAIAWIGIPFGALPILWTWVERLTAVDTVIMLPSKLLWWSKMLPIEFVPAAGLLFSALCASYLLFGDWWNRVFFVGRIPLEEASRVAYEKTPAGYFKSSAEQFGTEPDDVLRYYAFHIARMGPLYGKRLPSRKLERISDPTIVYLIIGIRDGKAVGKSQHGNGTFVDLCVDRATVRAAVHRFRQLSDTCAAAAC